MIAKKITYELDEDDSAFFLKPPETCSAAYAIIKPAVSADRTPTKDEHKQLWAHVEGCLPCIRNIIRAVGHSMGGVPLPVGLPTDQDHQVGPVTAWSNNKWGSN